MPYLDEHLLPGERIIYRTTLHPLYLAPGAIVLAVGLLTLISADFRQLGGFFMIAGALTLLVRGSTYVTNEYGLTSTRVVIKTGWGNRKTLELQLQKVEGLAV